MRVLRGQPPRMRRCGTQASRNGCGICAERAEATDRSRNRVVSTVHLPRWPNRIGVWPMQGARRSRARGARVDHQRRWSRASRACGAERGHGDRVWVDRLLCAVAHRSTVFSFATASVTRACSLGRCRTRHRRVRTSHHPCSFRLPRVGRSFGVVATRRSTALAARPAHSRQGRLGQDMPARAPASLRHPRHLVERGSSKHHPPSGCNHGADTQRDRHPFRRGARGESTPSVRLPHGIALPRATPPY